MAVCMRPGLAAGGHWPGEQPSGRGGGAVAAARPAGQVAAGSPAPRSQIPVSKSPDVKFSFLLFINLKFLTRSLDSRK